MRKGFTLIELLVVIAIIAVLAAILFPVFAKAKARGQATACLSNTKQIGIAVQLYVGDNDDRLFFYAGTASPSQSRTGAVISPSQKDAERWWNVLMPLLKSSAVFQCPSDPKPTPSNDANGKASVLRSYMACRSAEGLQLSQIDQPAQTMVIVDKWDRNSGGAVTDSWIEAFNGDFDYDNGPDVDHTRMFKAGNRHGGRANCVFFDGHAQSLDPAAIQSSKEYTGCSILYRHPVPGVMTVDGSSTAAGEPNICSAFSYP
ncbi:MAG TPA: prepilin-type N-terminal cleavage/methylation domain-containing protein [Armatimonadota bacterium]